MWKKIVGLITAITMIIGTGVTSFAEDLTATEAVTNRQTEGNFSEIIPFAVNNSTQFVTLSISTNNIAYTKCTIVGIVGVTKTSITATLQKKSGNTWTTVKTWSVTKNAKNATLEKTQKVADKGTYRMKVVFKAYKGSKWETKTVYSAIKKS